LGAWREFVVSGLLADEVSVENDFEEAGDGDGEGDRNEDEEPMIHIDLEINK
jgi:hypothetical protein